jgi:hypothetical protein
MGLPWIELHTDLPEHRKSIRLGILLRNKRAWTYLPQLWLWCAKNNVEGIFDGEEAKDCFEEAAGWDGEPRTFVEAAIKAGFADELPNGSIVVHRWSERAAAHIAKRERDRNRQREQRAKASKKYIRDVAATSRGRASDSHGNSNSNSNKETKKTLAPLAPDARHAPLRKALCEDFKELKGAEYSFNGKDAKAVQLLLARGSPEEVRARWRCALRLQKYPGTSDLSQLNERWNDFAGLQEAERIGPKRATPKPEPPCEACGASEGYRGKYWGHVLCGACGGEANGGTAASVETWLSQHRNGVNNVDEGHRA